MKKKVQSKPLGKADECGTEFIIEALKGDATAGSDVDSMFLGIDGTIVLELVRCEESQGSTGTTPYTSHPNRYWHLAWRKYKNFKRLMDRLTGRKTFYIVNYARKGEKYENEVLVIEALGYQKDKGFTHTNEYKLNRSEFSDWYRKVNKAKINEDEIMDIKPSSNFHEYFHPEFQKI